MSKEIEGSMYQDRESQNPTRLLQFMRYFNDDNTFEDVLFIEPTFPTDEEMDACMESNRDIVELIDSHNPNRDPQGRPGMHVYQVGKIKYGLVRVNGNGWGIGLGSDFVVLDGINKGVTFKDNLPNPTFFQ